MKKIKKASMLLGAALISIGLTATAYAEETIVFEDNFSAYSKPCDGNELVKNGYTFFNSWDKSLSGVEDVGGEFGQAAYVGLDAAHDNTQLFYELDEALDDVAAFSFSIKPATGITTSVNIIDSAGNLRTLLRFNTNKTMIRNLNGTESNYGISWTENTWYNVKAELDLSGKLARITIMDEAGNVLKCQPRCAVNITNVKKIGFQQWKNTDGRTYIDNIKVTERPTLPFFEDFADTNFTTFSKYSGVTVKEVEGHGNALAFVRGSGYDAPWAQKVFVTPYSSANSDNILIRASVCPKAGQRTYIIARGTNDGDVFLVDFNKSGKIQQQYTTIGSYTGGLWYDVYAVINLKTNRCHTMVIGEDGSFAARTNQDYWIKNFDELYLQMVSSSTSNISYMDDVEISRNTALDIPAIVAQRKLPINDDFESYETIDNISTTNYTISYKNIAELQTDDVYGKNFYVGLNSTTDNTYLRRNFGTTVSTGKISMKFLVKPGKDISTHINAYPQDNSYMTLLFFRNDDKKVFAGNTSGTMVEVGEYTPETWYECEVIIDIDNGLMDVAYGEPDGSLNEKTGINYNEITGKNFTGFKGIAFQVWAKKDSGSNVDNIEIKYVAGTPELSAEDVSFVKDGEVQPDSSELTPAVDTIKLNFHSMLNILNLSKELITITNVTDSEGVNYTPSVKGNVLEIALPDRLQPDKTYRINVSGAVKNIEGTALGQDFVMEFGTDSGEFTASLIGLEQNGVAVESLAGLTSGEANITINYENSTALDNKMALIYSYYNGLKLIRTECKIITIDSEEKDGIYHDASVVGDLTGADAVKVFLWDGLENIVPISEAISLK